MLRYVLLCLAAGLASSALVDAQILQFNDVFSFRYDLHQGDLTIRGAQWYDAINKKSRIDIENERFVFLESTPLFQYGVATQLIPMTNTEANVTFDHCVNITGSVSFPILGKMSVIQLTAYILVGATTLHGEIVEKWMNSILLSYTHIELFFYCVNRRDKNGVMQKVPLRWEGTRKDVYKPTTLHMILDIFNFDTSPIDPDVFDIQKGLKCEVHSIKQGDKHIYTNFWERFPWAEMQVDSFRSFQSKHNKQYGSEKEYSSRHDIFMKNLKRIEEHNRGNHGYKLAVNHFADQTEDEIIAMLTGRIQTDDAPTNALPFPYSEDEIEALSKDMPERFDWRDHGAVIHVKDQSNCGSCWAFAAIGAIEGAVYLHTNRTERMSLSEQALVECTWGFGNRGCYGGLPQFAFDFVKKSGIPTEFAYGPYSSRMDYCHMKNVKKGYTISDYVKIASNEEAFKVAILKHGPVSVAIEATFEMAFYSNGVFTPRDCHNDVRHLNHAVLVVGWGSMNGQEYWLIKNSWGSWWGENGYILMAVANNTCGVMMDGHYVTI